MPSTKKFSQHLFPCVCFYLFIYYLKFSHSQACIIITSFPGSVFFCRASKKKRRNKTYINQTRRVKLMISLSIGSFSIQRGAIFPIFSGCKCFWSVRCSDVSEFYCNFICLRQVSPRIKENESHLLTAAWK